MAEILTIVQRHMGMDMGSSATGSMAMNVASSTMAMAMTSATDSASDLMDMGGHAMHMYFTTQYKNYPVLFLLLSAANGGQAFGIFLLLFVVAFLSRGLEFVRNYLEQVVWKNPIYVESHPGQKQQSHKEADVAVKLNIEHHSCWANSEQSSIKADSTNTTTEPLEGQHSASRTNQLPLASRFFRDVIRLTLCILPDLFNYTLMLAAMSFSLVYFFAVVLGSGIGRFVFERSLERLNVIPPSPFNTHC